METRFNTILLSNSNGHIVIAYGLNKMYCSNCSRGLHDKDIVYTCQDSYGDVSNDHELRVLNCDMCERKKATGCINTRYDSIRYNHIHALAQLRICPLDVDVKKFVMDIK